MDIVQRWKSNIAWYQPTTDTDSWRYFYDTIYSVDYSTATAETLKNAAWEGQKLEPGLDVGMWTDRAARLQKFLSSDTALSDYDPLEAEAIQYDFVACFLNDFSAASHNEDLWESINGSALNVLNENIEPDATGHRALNTAYNFGAINPRWALQAIPTILYDAFKTINISYYRPTEDTDSWAYFQEIMFDLTAIPRVQFLYHKTYLLTNVTSTVDQGVWGTMASGAKAFLDANLGQMPATADQQIDFVIKFCDIVLFDYHHAAHNADLFETYYNAFLIAKEKYQLLLPHASAVA